jgi:rod shape determining protein RodA
LYVVVNVAMISGLIPVVGIPLPLVSYGGTAMLTLMVGCGLLLCVAVHKEVRLSKSGLTEW